MDIICILTEGVSLHELFAISSIYTSLTVGLIILIRDQNPLVSTD